MVDADNFEHNPIQAMVLVVSFLYARGIVTEPLAFEELLHKYSVIFDYPDENNAKSEVRNYIEDVKKIVDVAIGINILYLIFWKGKSVRRG